VEVALRMEEGEGCFILLSVNIGNSIKVIIALNSLSHLRSFPYSFPLCDSAADFR
jgi:hypothetical protein